MKPAGAQAACFIGWDVGGWNCDNNGKSRDAIVIIDEMLGNVGKPWRGNLRKCIAASATTSDWLKGLFAKCEAQYPEQPVPVTMAIDTPLGFPEEFVSLITRKGYAEADETSGRNRYLFRQTERHLFEKGKKPLSAIKDMIGSQATKGIHALTKFAPQFESCGVWTDGHGFRVIETYPAVCRGTKVVKTLLEGSKTLGHEDENDARVCAVIAHLFGTGRDSLEGPSDTVPHSEGWIWAPRSDA